MDRALMDFNRSERRCSWPSDRTPPPTAPPTAPRRAAALSSTPLPLRAAEHTFLYGCALCGARCNTQIDLDRHRLSRRHKRRVQVAALKRATATGTATATAVAPVALPAAPAEPQQRWAQHEGEAALTAAYHIRHAVAAAVAEAGLAGPRCSGKTPRQVARAPTASLPTPPPPPSLPQPQHVAASLAPALGVAEALHGCELCDIECQSASDLSAHCAGKRHKRRALHAALTGQSIVLAPAQTLEQTLASPHALAPAPSSRIVPPAQDADPDLGPNLDCDEALAPQFLNHTDIRCAICGISCSGVDSFNQHRRGRMHRVNYAEWQRDRRHSATKRDCGPSAPPQRAAELRPRGGARLTSSSAEPTSRTSTEYSAPHERTNNHREFVPPAAPEFVPQQLVSQSLSPSLPSSITPSLPSSPSQPPSQTILLTRSARRSPSRSRRRSSPQSPPPPPSPPGGESCATVSELIVPWAQRAEDTTETSPIFEPFERVRVPPPPLQTPPLLERKRTAAELEADSPRAERLKRRRLATGWTSRRRRGGASGVDSDDLPLNELRSAMRSRRG